MEIDETYDVMKDYAEYSLLGHNTFGMDAKCRRFLEFASEAEASDVAKMLDWHNQDYIIIGAGSNLLLTKDFDGTVLHSAIKGISATHGNGYVDVRCGSGEVWDEVVAHCVGNGWHGAENLSYIPGEVGASAVQNIGAYGAEAKDLIVKVEAVGVEDGKPVVFDSDDCHYAYRDSIFKHEWKGRYIITYVTYRMSLDFEPHLDYGNVRSFLNEKGIGSPTAEQLREAIIDIRKAKLPDPEVEGNAGSFFKNPIVLRSKYEDLARLYPSMPHYVVGEDRVKIPAGWMIEQCGWKGKSLGRAGVHSKQALVLVNRGGASGSEVVALYKKIASDVFSKFGIGITPEVNVI